MKEREKPMTYNHAEYMREWRRKNKEKIREIQRKYRANHPTIWRRYVNRNPQNEKRIRRETNIRRRFGTINRYNEALMKYEGECAFDSEHKAELVHHLDGKSIRNSTKEEVNNQPNNLLPLCKPCHMWLHITKIIS